MASLTTSNLVKHTTLATESPRTKLLRYFQHPFPSCPPSPCALPTCNVSVHRPLTPPDHHLSPILGRKKVLPPVSVYRAFRSDDDELLVPVRKGVYERRERRKMVRDPVLGSPRKKREKDTSSTIRKSIEWSRSPVNRKQVRDSLSPERPRKVEMSPSRERRYEDLSPPAARKRECRQCLDSSPLRERNYQNSPAPKERSRKRGMKDTTLGIDLRPLNNFNSKLINMKRVSVFCSPQPC
jgi:hypothetical protein